MLVDPAHLLELVLDTHLPRALDPGSMALVVL